MRGGRLSDIERDYQAERRFDPQADEAAAEHLFSIDPEALKAQARIAAARRDLGGMLAAGAVLHRHGALEGQSRDDYYGALRSEGRFREAAAVLGEALALQSEPSSGALLDHAEFLAAAGQFAAARASAQRASAAGWKDVRPENVARRAKWVSRSYRAPPGALSWEEARLAVEGGLMLDAVSAAETFLRRLLADPPPGDPPLVDAIGLARAGHQMGLHDLVRPLARRAYEDAPRNEAAIALQIQSSSMAGETATAAAMASSLPPLSEDEGLEDGARRQRRALRYAAAEAQAAAGDLEPAIRTLGALVTADRKDYLPLTALQRCTGDYVLGRLDLPWAPPRPPKIINLLPFYNERTLLELRLQEMGDWVDHFVVVEASTTFTGKPKPLNFEALRGAYADRGDQLLHVALTEIPDCMDTAWARDFYQRDMAVAALAGVWRPDDIILITDADEIVDHRALQHWPHLASLRMATSKHFLNYCAEPRSNHANRRSGAICRAETLARRGVTYVRTALSAARKDWETVPAAGWHFTSVGDAEGVTQKFNAYAHQEAGKEGLRDAAVVGDHLAAIRAGRYEPGWSRQPVDARFPRFVRNNQALLAPILLGD